MTVVLNLFGTKSLTESVVKKVDGTLGHIDHHIFPDQESRFQIQDNVDNEDVIIVTNLNEPDKKLIELILLICTARDLGAKKITLITPYLCYMRQDTRFNPGEGISAEYIADLLSHYVDHLITVDPHLHRFTELEEIYSIETTTIHVAPAITEYIKQHIEKPLLVGPDRESEQWVADIATPINAPYVVLDKIRHDDRTVEFSLSNHEKYLDRNPVLIDDIISTAITMSQSVDYLNKIGLMQNQSFSPICIGIHAIFAGDAYEKLKAANPKQIITCNTIEHETNGIDINPMIVDAIS